MLEETNKKNEVVKVLLLGPPQCGKSCIAHGYKQSYSSTIGVDFSKRTFNIDGNLVDFHFWDISASMTFNEKNKEYCKNGEIVALVYSVNDPNSFTELQSLAQRLIQQDKLRYDAKLVIVGAKIDLDRLVQQNTAYEASLVLKGDPSIQTSTYFEISMKTDPKALKFLCQGLYQVYKNKNIKSLSQLNQDYKPQETAPSQKLEYVPPNKFANAPKVQQDPEYTKLYKILLIGDDKVGKSSIVSKFARNQMIYDYIPTIGVDFAIKNVQINGIKVKLQIWDTAGMQKFKAITTAYMKGCQIMLVVFDCTCVQSFQNLYIHMQDIQKYSMNVQNIGKYIVANKIDLPRNISMQEGMKFASEHGYKYIEVSALQNINIDYLFMNSTDQTIKKQYQ